jgi:putative FmdB family regulatory protein
LKGVWRLPTYGYRCSRCGSFDVRREINNRLDAEPCPSCARPSRRVFDAPALRGVHPGLRRALDAQQRSAHEPTVVRTDQGATLGPSRRATPVSTDPRHARLPRP